METTDCTVVTGASRGIGRAIALRMAMEGPVIVVGRERLTLNAVMKDIWNAGGRASISVGDVTDPATAAEAVRVASLHGWRVRHLVCNAGIGKSCSIETLDPAAWSQIFDVNVNGAFHFIQACLPQMLEDRKGSVVLMSSVSGLKGASHNAPYSASKHALIGLAKTIAHEHGKNGIVSVPICPGYVESEMTERSINGYAERHGVAHDAARQKIADVNPQKRIIPAEEIAEAVAFVCSGKVPSLSGHPMILSGGS
jgi:3-hydroxybutyrate dehydrogenase